MNADKIVAYMAVKNYQINKNPGCCNIVYIEGVNEDGTPNKDLLDGWNDRRMVILFENGAPVIVHNVEATTEPGAAATFSKAAKQRGGVARIAFGQFFAWQMGYHKRSPHHPALVQAAPLPVHRDANQDGKRPRDPMFEGIFGINQHGTKPGAKITNVGTWSEGCLVGRDWAKHIEFITLLRQDPRYQKDQKYIWCTTVINGDDFSHFQSAL